jgi:hypothetical protein
MNRSNRTKRIVPLGTRPRHAGILGRRLKIARRDVDGEGVASNVTHRISLFHIASLRTNDNGQFDLVMNAADESRQQIVGTDAAFAAACGTGRMLEAGLRKKKGCVGVALFISLACAA